MKTKPWIVPLALSLGLLLGLSLLLLSSTPATTAGQQTCVPGPHTGTIISSQEWCPQNNPHVLSGDVLVANGAVLTILPGVVVQGQPQAADDGTELRVQGSLQANGTLTEPITFTSVGNSAAGQWGGVVIDGGAANLTYVVIRYAGLGNHANVIVRNATGSLIDIQNSSLLTESAAVADYGLYIENSRVRVANGRIGGNGDSTADYGVLAIGAATVVTLSQVTIDLNAGTGVSLTAGSRVQLNHDIVRNNGGHGVAASGANTQLVLRGGTIATQAGNGVDISSGLASLSLIGVRLVSNGGDAIRYDGSGSTLMRYSTIFNNTGLGLRNQNPAVCFDAKYVYWGDLGGPNDPSSAPDGCLGPVANSSPSGQEVTDDVAYEPWVGEAPTATLAGPSLGALLVYTDVQGLRSSVAIPAGVSAGTVIFVYLPLPPPTSPTPPGWGFAGHAFDLSNYGSGSALPGFTFLKPVTFTVEYSDADLGGLDETTLRLFYWTGLNWADAAGTCSPLSQYQRDLANNRLSLPVCHLTEFALLVQRQTHLVYLPVIDKRHH